MRSIIFTSLFCVAANMSVAQDHALPGCYTRAYSQAHLDAHPQQVVREMRLWVRVQNGVRDAIMDVQFANQGHVATEGRGSPQARQVLSCFDLADGTPFCGVECDGGGFVPVRQTDDSLTIELDYLLIGTTPGEEEVCGGEIDLAEVPGQTVRYRLNRADIAQCEGM